MSNPSEWNRLGAMENFPTGPAKERVIVPGVPAVYQPLVLLGGEWVCAGCGQPIGETSRGFGIRHDHGCETVSDMAQEVASSG